MVNSENKQIPEALFNKIMAEYMPKDEDDAVKQNKRQQAQKAIRQLYQDLTHLSEQTPQQLDDLVESFYRAFFHRHVENDEGELIELDHLFDASDSTILKNINGEPHPDTPQTYRQDLAWRDLQPSLEQQMQANSSNFKKSFKEILDITAQAMQYCRQNYRLTYHTIWHALMVSNMSHVNARDSHLDAKWALLTSMMGLMHDAVYTKQQGQDEHDSAELFLETNQFYKHLSAEKQATFAALTRIILDYGTLPFVHAQNKDNGEELGKEKPDFDTIKMEACIDVFVQHDSYFNNMPGVDKVLAASQALAKADIHGSLNPDRFLKSFPTFNQYNMTEGLADSNQPGSLLGFLNQYYEDNQANIRCDESLFKTTVLLKFIQSMGVMTESCYSGLPDNDNPIFKTQAKMDQIIYRTRDTELDEQDLKLIAGDPDDLSQQPGLMNGEFFFAKMQFRGFRPDLDFATLQELPEFGETYPESWQWHYELYHRIRHYMLDQTQSLESRVQCAYDLLTLAGNQPGRYLNISSLERKFKQAPAYMEYLSTNYPSSFVNDGSRGYSVSLATSDEGTTPQHGSTPLNNIDEVSPSPSPYNDERRQQPPEIETTSVSSCSCAFWRRPKPQRIVPEQSHNEQQCGQESPTEQKRQVR